MAHPGTSASSRLGSVAMQRLLACLAMVSGPAGRATDDPGGRRRRDQRSARGYGADPRRSRPGMDRRRHGHRPDPGRPQRGRTSTHPPAPSRCCWRWSVLDEVPLDSTDRRRPTPTPTSNATASASTPGRTYTARQLLDGAAAGLRQRRRQHPGPHARRPRRRGGEDERQGGAAGRHTTRTSAARRASTAPGWRCGPRPHDLAVIFRAAMANPVFAQITAQPTRGVPHQDRRHGRWSTRTSCCTATPARSAARPASPTWPARRSSAPPSATAAAWWSR